MDSISRAHIVEALGSSFSDSIDPIVNSLSYLNGADDPRQNSKRAWWTEIRNSITTLSKFIGKKLTYEFDKDSSTYHLCCDTVKLVNPWMLLRNLIDEKTFSSWEALASQGAFAKEIRANGKTSSVIFLFIRAFATGASSTMLV